MFGYRFSICSKGRSRLHTLDVISRDVPGRFQIMDGLKFYFKKLRKICFSAHYADLLFIADL